MPDPPVTKPPVTKSSTHASAPATTAEARAPLAIPVEIKRKLAAGEVRMLEMLVDIVVKRTLDQHVEALLWQRLQGVRKNFEQAEELVERSRGRQREIFSNEEYRNLISLLHIDAAPTLADAHRNLTAAFQAVTSKQLLLRQPPERYKPSDTLPKTAEELFAWRVRKDAERRAARQQKAKRG
jgi:hypothetical protein